jgi:superfamily II DNA/RNA helicase
VKESPAKPAVEDELKETEEVKEYNDFEEMGINMNILRGIYGYGFEKPSII